MTTESLAGWADRAQLLRIIAALDDGIIVLEADGALSYANATALAMHGIESPDELGADLAAYQSRFTLRYRNGHVLEPSEYPGQRLLAGEAIRDVVLEVSKRNDIRHWTHVVRGIAVSGKGTAPAFCVLILNDVTEEFNAEARFERAFAANPAPALICRLLDHRYVKVNDGFLEMTGYTREMVIGRTIYELDVLAGAKSREHAIGLMSEGRMIPQTEARLRLPGGGGRQVIVAGQPIEVGHHACLLFTFIDIEPRHRAETALRQSEERFACAFRLSPVPMLISSLKEHRILDANDAFVREFGHERSGAVGRSKAELAIWSDDDARRIVEDQLNQTGSVRSQEVRLRTRDGRVLACLLSSEGVTILDERCVLTVIQNVTPQRRSDTQLIAAVEAVMQDASWLGQKIVARINSLADGEEGTGDLLEAADLSQRERQVLALIARGATDKAIAATLQLSFHTVKNHVRAIYRKTGINKRAEAVAWARHCGVVNHAHERR